MKFLGVMWSIIALLLSLFIMITIFIDKQILLPGGSSSKIVSFIISYVGVAIFVINALVFIILFIFSLSKKKLIIGINSIFILAIGFLSIIIVSPWFIDVNFLYSKVKLSFITDRMIINTVFSTSNTLLIMSIINVIISLISILLTVCTRRK